MSVRLTALARATSGSIDRISVAAPPQHFLYFRPLPQGQGSLRWMDMAVAEVKRENPRRLTPH